MSETKRSLKVFLCHAHDDKLKTRELYRYLRKRGIQPWLDAEDLVGGQDWRVEIPKAIKTSDAIIICLSKNSINKEGFVQAEITFALEKALEIPQGRIFIIPARFEDCEVPSNLERFHWVDLFEEDGFPRLMKSLKTRAGQLERSTVQVPQPDESSPNLNPSSEEKIESEATLEMAKREMAEKAVREKAEKETAEKARLEAEELAEKEKAEHEVAKKAARDKAEEDAVEKTRLEAEEQARLKAAKEKTEREVAEKIAREKAEKESAEKARLEAEEQARQKAEREAAEKTAREKAEKDAAQKARLQAEEQARQKSAKEKAEREAVEKPARSLLKNRRIIIPVAMVLFLCVIIFAVFPVITKSDISSTPVSPGISDLNIPPFSAAEDVYIYFNSDQTPSSQKFESRWFLKVNILWADLYIPVGYLEYIPVNRESHLFFHLKNPGIAGEYRVDIYMDQNLVGTQTFEIYPKE